MLKCGVFNRGGRLEEKAESRREGKDSKGDNKQLTP